MSKKIKKQLNQVTEQECIDAIDYFWQTMDLDENIDKVFYTKILLKKVANNFNIKLEGI
tara:strand:- start:493 stop:669 length:177 start_codon:yes stop_codon:yes gene_type:complete